MIESPSSRSPEMAPRWDLMGTEGCGGGKVVSWLPAWFQGIRVYIGERSTSVELRGADEGGGHAYPPGRVLLPRGFLVAFQASTPSLLDCVCSKNNSTEGFIPFGLRLIFLFYETLK